MKIDRVQAKSEAWKNEGQEKDERKEGWKEELAMIIKTKEKEEKEKRRTKK